MRQLRSGQEFSVPRGGTSLVVWAPGVQLTDPCSGRQEGREVRAPNPSEVGGRRGSQGPARGDQCSNGLAGEGTGC